MGPGQFFGELELVHGGNSLATVRAAEGGEVELLILPHAEFIKMMEGSPLTEDAICRIVQHRLEENRTFTSKVNC